MAHLEAYAVFGLIENKCPQRLTIEKFSGYNVPMSDEGFARVQPTTEKEH
jgi:hypothetical protein